MIYLELFWIFFKIGLFTIGGGYAMIPLMESETISRGWITDFQLMNFLAVSESTPGPFAINMATFIGFSQGGFLGGVVATISVVLPSLIIITVITYFIDRFLRNRFFSSFIDGVKPIVVGLIIGVAVTLFYTNTIESGFDWKALVIAILALIATHLPIKISPILVIVFSGILGIILYGCL